MLKKQIDVRQFLANLPLFGAMTESELDLIATGVTELRVESGNILFKRGDLCVGFHTVIYGQVKLSVSSAQGSEKVVEIVGPSHSFGEALMFMEKPYIVTAQALEDTMLLHISKEVIFAGLERDTQFSRKMLASLSRRLHGVVADVEAISLRSGTQRVIGYLLKDDDVQNGSTVTLPVSKMVIASRLNLTPEHFSRILHDLSENKLITVNGRDIAICDFTGLQNVG